MKYSMLIFIITAAYFLPSVVFAQNKSELTEALILTKAGDTLLCFIPMQVQYRDRIEYRSHSDAEAKKLNARDIISVVTETRILESVMVDDRYELMTLVVSGRASLYNSVTITDASFGPTPNAYSPQSTSVNYVIKKDGGYHSIGRHNFKKDVSELFSDCPSLIRKIADKEYKFIDMEAIAREYNPD